MTDNRPYIEITLVGQNLIQYASNTLIGENIVIDYGDGNIENYNGDYSHSYSTSDTYTIKIYGVTKLGKSCFAASTHLKSIIIPNTITEIGESCFSNCTNLTSVILSNGVTKLGSTCFTKCINLESINIPNTITEIGANCFSICSNLTEIIFNWTLSSDILTFVNTWIKSVNNSCVFTIPMNTFSLYEAKGYPTAKLVERSPDLFVDVKNLVLEGKEVESIVVDEVDGRVLYQKPHTEILLSATNNTISYGDSLVLNGTVSNISYGIVKLYQNDVLLDILTSDSNGSFTKTISNLNVGTYTYKAVYDGDTQHNDGESNGIIITVNKVTPVLTLSSDKNTIHSGETITLTGTTTVDGTINFIQIGGTMNILGSVESANGTFTYTFTNTRTINVQIFAVISQTNTSNEAQSNTLNFTYSKYSTNLTIEVPTLVYSDIFNVTGVLTDENNNPLSNASVKLYRDNVLEATETTDSNGEVTFHRNAPTSITTYTFQLQYSGDSYYNSSNSSIVNRTVNKETSVLNITSPLDNSNYSNNELITVTGNLSDNDATPLANKNIIINNGEKEHFYINNNCINGSNLDTNLTYIIAHVNLDEEEIYGYVDEYNPFSYDGEIYYIYSTEATVNEIYTLMFTYGISLINEVEEYGDIQFNYLGEISETNTEFAIENILTTLITDNVGDFSGTINSNLLDIGENSLTFNFVEEAYYTGATQSITVTITGSGVITPTPSSLTLNASKTILSCADAFKNWTHPYTMGIDEENGLPYLTPTGSGVILNNIILPSEFEINYKFKTTNNTTSGNALLFNVGTDVNNGILIGNEGSSRQMHIYTRVNNSNSGVAIQQNVYNYQEWTDVNIRYEDNIISITMNEETISYTLTNPNLIQNYLAVYGTGVPNVRFTNFEIIDVSDGSIVYSSSENTSTEITATVLDENDSPCSNEIVTFNIGLHEIQKTTDSNGVATLDYSTKQMGDVPITATLNNLSDSIIVEDCLFYNDGSDITNLRKQSNNINLSTNGEWLTISKSSSGEECVWLPAPLCCFTGSDNWEMSMKCNPSDYSSQALAIQMYGCNYGGYSGDSQYWGYTPNNFYGYLTGSYALTSSDKVTYRRENGYWKVYVNDNTLITSKSYNWSGNRQVGLYSNSGRRQNVKEWKVKKNIPVNNLELISDKSRVNIDNDETVTLSATLTSLNIPVINTIITFKEDGVIIGTATTDNNGVATYTYEPSDYGDYTVSAEYSSLSGSVVINANDGSNILYYNSGADLSKVSDFDINNGWASKNASNGTYTVSSDGSEWLTVTRSGGSNYGHIPIAPLTGINVPFKLSVIVEMIAYGDPYNASYSGLYALNKSTNYSFLCQWGYPFRMCRSDKGSSDNWSSWNSGGNVSNGTYKYEVVFEASRVTHNLYDLNNTLLKTYNTTTSLNHTTATAEFGIHTDVSRNFRIKEIIAELLD